jgi:hypothetical protein
MYGLGRLAHGVSLEVDAVLLLDYDCILLGLLIEGIDMMYVFVSSIMYVASFSHLPTCLPNYLIMSTTTRRNLPDSMTCRKIMIHNLTLPQLFLSS